MVPDRFLSSSERRPADAGLTLVETLLALGILSFGILVLFGVVRHGRESQAHSADVAMALEIAASRMELVKIDPPAFFLQAPSAVQPTAPLAGLWQHDSLNLDFGEIPGHPEFACYVVLTGNLAAKNSALVRIPVIWRRVGGRFSTTDGEPFDPNQPDAHPAMVELRSVVRYR